MDEKNIWPVTIRNNTNISFRVEGRPIEDGEQAKVLVPIPPKETIQVRLIPSTLRFSAEKRESPNDSAQEQ